MQKPKPPFQLVHTPKAPDSTTDHQQSPANSRQPTVDGPRYTPQANLPADWHQADSRRWMAPANSPRTVDIPQWMAPVDGPSSMITSSNTQLTSITHLQQPKSSFCNTPLQYTQPSGHATVDGPSNKPSVDTPQWLAPVDSPSSMITSSNTQLTSIAHSQQPMSSFRNTPLQYTQPSGHATVDGPSRPRGGDYPTTATPHLNTAPCTLDDTTGRVHSSDCTQHPALRFQSPPLLRNRHATSQASQASHGRKSHPQPYVDKKQRPA